ncbi:MAG: PilW family protein [Bacillota bacterium]
MQGNSQAGSSMVELIVGGAIALIVLGVIISMQISGYRYQKNDEERFVVQMESATALDRLTRDLRMASAVTLGPGGSSITLAGSGASISYSHSSGTGEVVRTENGVQQVVGQHVESLAFYLEGSARTVRIEWLARLPDGTTYLLVSRAAPRVYSGG